MNEDDLKKLLQQQPPVADNDTKARHMAAAMAAFHTQSQQPEQSQTDKQSVDVREESSTTQKAARKKNSNILQGFLQRLRLTRDTNHHGTTSMSNASNNTGFDHRSFWQKPVIVSGIAASSLAVVAGLTFMQQLMIDPSHSDVTATAFSKNLPLNTPHTNEHDAVEEVVITGARQVLAEEQAKKIARMESAQLARSKQAYAAAPAAKVMADAQPTMLALPAPAYAVHDSLAQPAPQFRDRFSEVDENGVIAVSANPVSTFSIDVDTASYSFVRRMLSNGQLPPKDAVRSEELINYFDYAYTPSKDRTTPFATYTNVMDSPWTKGNKLIHIGIQGYQLSASEIPRSNLVFLLDVSGSMDEPGKLPLVKQSMSLLLDTLKPDDTIAIAVYAGAAGTVLEPTKVSEKQKILAALNNLQAGGSTAGAEGIALAYQLAEANFNKDGVNRIILATDGDFNVGQTDDDALQDFVERKREKGIYLSVLGFGQGNYQDALMQTLAQNGNGTAAYIDTLSEAQKVLVTEATSLLFPIAQDVKIQVEFNPNTVKEYRLIGYETRALKQEDFNNDKVDAGEIGAGQRVTAIYEITPVGAESGLLGESRYQKESKPVTGKNSEYAFLRLRYKLPGDPKSQLIEKPITTNNNSTSPLHQREVNFATAVAGFAQLLRGSPYAGDFTYDKVIELARANKGMDDYGYRTEFIQLVRKAKIAQ